MRIEHMSSRRFVVKPLDEHAECSRFGGLDARAKLVGVLVFVVASALLTRQDIVFVSLAMSLVLVGASALPIRHVAKLYLGALPFILLASLSFFLFSGVEKGVTMWARASACVLALIVLASSTQTFELFSGLRRLRVPAMLTTLLMLSHKYIVVLSDELSRMTLARRARAFSGGRNLLDRYALKVISFTAGMVLVRSSERADRVYEGLKAKGFEKDLTGWRTSVLGVSDIAFVMAFVAASAVLLVLQTEVIA